VRLHMQLLGTPRVATDSIRSDLKPLTEYSGMISYVLARVAELPRHAKSLRLVLAGLPDRDLSRPNLALCCAVVCSMQGPAKVPSPPKSAAAPGQQRRAGSSSSSGFGASPRFASGRAASGNSSSSSRKPEGEAGGSSVAAAAAAAAGQQQQRQRRQSMPPKMPAAH
jgi:hypothetical protein